MGTSNSQQTFVLGGIDEVDVQAQVGVLVDLVHVILLQCVRLVLNGAVVRHSVSVPLPLSPFPLMYVPFALVRVLEKLGVERQVRQRVAELKVGQKFGLLAQ